MKKCLNNFGFTLVETMVAIGISSVLILALINAQKNIARNTGTVGTASELDSLIQFTASELSRTATCERNFIGKNVVNPPGSLPPLVNKSNQSFLATGQFGKELNIISIETLDGGSVGTPIDASTSTTRIMNLKISYNFTSEVPPVPKNFIIPINVFLDNSNNLITSCYSDVQFLLKEAVKASCKMAGIGAKYNPPTGVNDIGTCERSAKLSDSTGATITNSGNCPAGELLQRVDNGTGAIIFKCGKVSAGKTCTAWQYLDKVDGSSSNCRDIRSLFSGQPVGFTVIENGTYRAFALACFPGQVMKGIKPGGGADCLDPQKSYGCSPGYYIDKINDDQTAHCAPVGDPATVCGGSTDFITRINSDGTITCGSTAVTPTCAAGTQYISGINASGNAVCSAMP
jgi:prepilin-type N-terminal cleavage/methylation domain-containing protein